VEFWRSSLNHSPITYSPIHSLKKVHLWSDASPGSTAFQRQTYAIGHKSAPHLGRAAARGAHTPEWVRQHVVRYNATTWATPTACSGRGLRYNQRHKHTDLLAPGRRRAGLLLVGAGASVTIDAAVAHEPPQPNHERAAAPPRPGALLARGFTTPISGWRRCRPMSPPCCCRGGLRN
jgi:hypothetical protein